MTRLLHDRYVRLDGNRACDLVTGNDVRLDSLADGVSAEDAPSLRPIIEALDHGRDGYPRWIVAWVQSRRQATATIEAVAAAAVRRGYVAMSIDAYRRFRDILWSDLADRAVMLACGCGGDPSHAHAALLHASAASPRPHVLLTFRSAHGAGGPALVREARAAYPARHRDLGTSESPEIAALVVKASRARQFCAAGRHAAAERLLRDVAGALVRRSAYRPAGRLMITLARLFHERGRSDAASAALEDAARLGQSAEDPSLVVEARIWQASARIACGAAQEAEAICRAVLAADGLPTSVRTWARAALADALLWQGRIDDVPVTGAVTKPSGLDEAAVAATLEVEVRVLLAAGHMFEAGRRVEALRGVAARTTDPLVDVIAHTSDLAVLTASGDLGRARAAFDTAIATCRAARAPARGAWARLAWVDTLRRAGCPEEAVPHLARLRRLGRASPILLQREIEKRVAGSVMSIAPRIAALGHSRHSSLAVALVRLAQDDDDETGAIIRLLQRVSVELQTSRVDLVSDDGGPVTTICSVGEGLPSSLGGRVLETAFAIGPERQHGGLEIGVPVRLGARIIGAMVCRWSMDRAMPAEAGELLDLAAAIAAPRVDALRTAKRDEANASTAVPELIGVSDAIVTVRSAIVRAAAAPFALLIEGESGVGKELAARAVHQLSPRRERRFCDVNCAALPEDLLESELFGHTRGAFSGAVTDRAGLFEDADGGTLFLDEVVDLSPRAQAKLLRAVQQQEVRRVGESFNRKIDVRLVAAANRDMRAEAAAGRFRQDLLYRLDVLRIRIPPLRERPEDIPVLATHCWRAAAARVGSKAELSPSVLLELSRYHWPGNVRELQNVIAALAVAAPAHGRVRPVMLPPVISAATSVWSGRLADAREQFERRFVEVALARAGGNRARAARSLGLSRQGLLKALSRLGLDQATPDTPAGGATPERSPKE